MAEPDGDDIAHHLLDGGLPLYRVGPRGQHGCRHPTVIFVVVRFEAVMLIGRIGTARGRVGAIGTGVLWETAVNGLGRVFALGARSGA